MKQSVAEPVDKVLTLNKNTNPEVPTREALNEPVD